MSSFTINKEKRTFDFDDGTSVPIPADKVNDILGINPGTNPQSRERTESFRKSLHETNKMFGEGLGQSALTVTSEATPSLLTKGADYLRSAYDAYQSTKDKPEASFYNEFQNNYAADRKARKQFSEDITKEQPASAYLGKGLGLAGEVYATRKLPVAAAAPILGAANSETSAIFNPGTAALEAVADTALGYGVGKFFEKLSKFSRMRQARRDVKTNIAQTEAANSLETQRAGSLNQAEAERFARDTTSREAQVEANAVAQNQAQQQFSEGVANTAGKISSSLGKATIPEAALAIEDFIVNNIDRTALAGTPEASSISKFIRTVFKTPKEGMTGKHLEQAYKALEDRVATSQGAERDLLLGLKDTLAQKMPSVIAEASVYGKYGSPLAKEAVKDVVTSVSKLTEKLDPLVKSGLDKHAKKDIFSELEKSLSDEILAVFENNSGNFSEAITNGTLLNELEQTISKSPALIQLKEAASQARLGKGSRQFPLFIGNDLPVFLNQVESIPQKLINRIESRMSKIANNAEVDKALKMQQVDKFFGKTKGAAQAIPEPVAVAPQQTITPNLQEVPTLPQAQTRSEGFMNWIEDTGVRQQLATLKSTFGNYGNAAGAGAVAKLAGLPLAKVVAGGAVGTAGVKLLTSPGMAGRVARQSLKQGLLQSYIQSRAQGYPSFRSGILDDPQDRRMLTREIEDDPSLSLEDKAVYQAKINRGQPL